MISDLLLDLIDMIGHEAALRFIEQRQTEEEERYADEMTARWQEE